MQKLAIFDHVLQAQVYSRIMTFWGIVVTCKGKTVILNEDCGKGGFDFFVKLYDGRKQ